MKSLCSTSTKIGGHEGTKLKSTRAVVASVRTEEVLLQAQDPIMEDGVDRLILLKKL